MRWVRFLLWFVLGLGVLWGSYWFVGARALERATQAWFEGRKPQDLWRNPATSTSQALPTALI